MSKCGKGCMPECEYFTTGGCISPFNCPYRIEELNPNSATSISDAFVQGLIAETRIVAVRDVINKFAEKLKESMQKFVKCDYEDSVPYYNANCEQIDDVIDDIAVEMQQELKGDSEH